MPDTAKYLNIANLLKALVTAVVGLVMATAWVMTNVVMSEDFEAYQRQSSVDLVLMKLDLQIDDVEFELFKHRLTPRVDQDAIYRALLGRLQDQFTKYTNERTAILKPVVLK